ARPVRKAEPQAASRPARCPTRGWDSGWDGTDMPRSLRRAGVPFDVLRWTFGPLLGAAGRAAVSPFVCGAGLRCSAHCRLAVLVLLGSALGPLLGPPATVSPFVCGRACDAPSLSPRGGRIAWLAVRNERLRSKEYGDVLAGGPRRRPAVPE